jgi:dTDP-4-dehydrorhamnose reductase
LKGFTDVHFCPLYVGDWRGYVSMLEKKTKRAVSVVSRECLSKYDFGRRIADRFEWMEA